jgi:very-short-patch-repair endonuclease
VKKLSIEIDGGVHERNIQYDTRRDAFVKRAGFDVVRIKNKDVIDFDYTMFVSLPQYQESAFRSALGRANAIKSNNITKLRKRA